MKYLLLLVCLTSVVSACYRMPTEEDFCTIPTHNNPSLTRQGTTDFTPTVKY